MPHGKEEVVLYPAEYLATLAQWEPGAMIWEFATEKIAKLHLNRYKRFFSGWAFNFKFPYFAIRSGSSNREWVYPAVEQPGINPEGGVFFTPKKDEDVEKYLITCQQRLSPELLEVMLSLSRDPSGMKGIVKWKTHKQVALTTDCIAIPIGTELPTCFRYGRQTYWNQTDFERFLHQCRDELQDDGSNTIQFEYNTIDPTTGGDPIRVRAEYRMLNAGSLGFYQIATGIWHESIVS